MQPLSVDIGDLRILFTGLSEPMIKQVAIRLFAALDFLHTDANLIHCGKVIKHMNAWFESANFSSRYPAEQYALGSRKSPII